MKGNWDVTNHQAPQGTDDVFCSLLNRINFLRTVRLRKILSCFAPVKPFTVIRYFMTQRVTRDSFERRFQQRVGDEIIHRNYQSKIRSETLDKVHQETDARAIMRQKAGRQRIADEEYAMGERLYRQQREQELRAREISEQDAIASALREQELAEMRDQKYRGVLRDNDPDYRDLKSKLQLALVSQTRVSQLRESRIRREMEEQERLETEEEMMRNYRRSEEERAAEEEAKHQEALLTKAAIQEQMADKTRRHQLVEVAGAQRDREQLGQIMSRIAGENAKAVEDLRRSQALQRNDMNEFMAARAQMKAEEARLAAEEDAKLRAFNASVDERLGRAIEEQRRREAQRARIAQKIALEVKRKKDDDEAYENMCLELALQQEMQKLADREAAEARKIEKLHEDCKRFMQEMQRAKALEAQKSREEEAKFQRVVMEQQTRLAELAAIEQEKNRLRIEKFRRELNRQLAQKKLMYEEQRQDELRKLRIEQEREEERQRILNEERRKLVIAHILSLGPEAVRYLPKGVLQEDDLNYLPEDYRNAVLRLQSTPSG
jgi:hypothetical protein